jgi:hypothetical protein
MKRGRRILSYLSAKGAQQRRRRRLKIYIYIKSLDEGSG